MSIRAGLQAWKHFAALLIAAAIVLAAPYGIAVAVRSAIASIILWNTETAISRTPLTRPRPVPPSRRGRKPRPDRAPPHERVVLPMFCKWRKRRYCAASLAIACSFAAVSSLRDIGCGMAMTL